MWEVSDDSAISPRRVGRARAPRVAPGRRRRAGCSAHGVGRPGSPGDLHQQDHHAARAARGAGRQGVPHRRRGGGAGAGAAAAQPGSAGRAAAAHRGRRQRRRLQQLLAGRRHAPDQPHLADRRSAQRPAAGADRGRDGPQGGPRRVISRRRPLRLLGGPGAERPLPGLVGRPADAAERLQQQLHRDADARPRGDLRGDDPRHAHHPHRRARSSSDERAPVARRRPRPLGRRHAGRRDHEPAADDGQRRRGRRRSGPAPHGERPDGRHDHRDRAVHAERPRQPALRVHGRRSDPLHAELRRRVPVHRIPGRGAAVPLRVRLPRGELQHDQHPRRRARQGAGDRPAEELAAPGGADRIRRSVGGVDGDAAHRIFTAAHRTCRPLPGVRLRAPTVREWGRR